MDFHVYGLGKNLLFKSILGRCATALKTLTEWITQQIGRYKVSNRQK